MQIVNQKPGYRGQAAVKRNLINLLEHGDKELQHVIEADKDCSPYMEK